LSGLLPEQRRRWHMIDLLLAILLDIIQQDTDTGA
jgi:hypothetical protein